MEEADDEEDERERAGCDVNAVSAADGDVENKLWRNDMLHTMLRSDPTTTGETEEWQWLGVPQECKCRADLASRPSRHKLSSAL